MSHKVIDYGTKLKYRFENNLYFEIRIAELSAVSLTVVEGL